jgi:hypothetical protein
LAVYNKKNTEINVEKGIITLREIIWSNGPHNFTKKLNQIAEGKFHSEFYQPEDTLENKINARLEKEY